MLNFKKSKKLVNEAELYVAGGKKFNSCRVETIPEHVGVDLDAAQLLALGSGWNGLRAGKVFHDEEHPLNADVSPVT